MASRFNRNAGYVVAGSIALSTPPAFYTALENIGDFYLSDLLVILLVLSMAPTLIVGGTLLISPRLFNVAVAVAVMNSLFPYTLEPPISGMLVFGHSLSSSMISVIFASLIAIAVSFIPRDFTARAVAAAGVVLVTAPALQLAAALYESGLARHSSEVLARAAAEETMPSPLPEPAASEDILPDILYIVPDRYAGNDVLLNFFDYDNSPFTDELKRRGFFVADDAQANYSETRASLASMFQMQYLTAFSRRMHRKTTSRVGTYELIRRNHTIHRLQKLGYRYVHLPSWWDGSNRAPLADLTKNYWASLPGGELGKVTLPRNLFVRAYLQLVPAQSSCAKLKQQLRFLETAGDDGIPTFVFAHVLVPHDPILTDAEGRCIKPINYPSQDPFNDWNDFKAAYVGYLTYLNSRLLDIFDRQQARDESVLFVIQADEGPRPRVMREDPQFDWRYAPADAIRMKFGILNALYLGGRQSGALAPPLSSDLSPVNNWRVLFSILESRSYPRLPNRSYIFPPGDAYRPIEVTERLPTPAIAEHRASAGGSFSPRR